MRRRLIAILLVLSMTFGPEMEYLSAFGVTSIYAEEIAENNTEEAAPAAQAEPAPAAQAEPAPAAQAEPAPAAQAEPAPAAQAEPTPAPQAEPAQASQAEATPAQQAEPAQASQVEAAPAAVQESAPAAQADVTPTASEGTTQAEYSFQAADQGSEGNLGTKDAAAEGPGQAGQNENANTDIASDQTNEGQIAAEESTQDVAVDENKQDAIEEGDTQNVSEDENKQDSAEAESKRDLEAGENKQDAAEDENKQDSAESEYNQNLTEGENKQDSGDIGTEKNAAAGGSNNVATADETNTVAAADGTDNTAAAQDTVQGSETQDESADSADMDALSNITPVNTMLAASPKAVGSTSIPISYDSTDEGTALRSTSDSTDGSSASSTDESESLLKGTSTSTDNGGSLLKGASSSNEGAGMLRAGSGSGSESEPSLLQEMITNALNAVSGTLKGRIAVTLKKDTIYSGDVAISAGGRQAADDFELELVAEDAGDDGMSADGSILFTGSMVIRDLAVIIKGMGLKGAVSVQDAKLQYFGTRQDDDVNVTVNGANASADIQTGEGDDNLNVAAENGGSLTVDTGSGSDKVKASVAGGGKADIRTGSDNDTVDLKQGQGSVLVNTGNDDDTITVTDFGGEGSLNIRAGLGSDSVILAGRVSEEYSGSSVTRREKIDIDLGDGIDEAVVDLSVAAVAAQVNVAGGEGSDRLHLTGYLKSTVAEDERITGTAKDLVLAGAQGTLNLTSRDVESLTDDLKNKRTVLVGPDEGDNDTSFTATVTDPFTNYVYTGSAANLSNLTVTKADGQELPLTSFILDARIAGEDGTKLTISRGAKLSAPGIQLVFRGKEISFASNSLIEAGMIRAEAYSATSANVPVVALGGTEIPVDLLNISDKASVEIRYNTVMRSEGDIFIQAKAEQDSGLLTLFPSMNLLDLKLAKATVDMFGKLYAGGSVNITASTDTTAGIDGEGNACNGLPFAATVASADAVINIGTLRNSSPALASEIQAESGSIRLNAKTRLHVSTRAASTNGLPVAIAASVLTSDASVNIVSRSKLEAGKDVIISSSGDVDVATIADKGEGQKGVTGGYLSAAVVLQHVSSNVSTNSNITAGNDVIVKSAARERVDTRAEAGAAGQESDVSLSIGQTYDELMTIWDGVKNQYFSGDSDQQKKLDDAVQKIAVSDHSVRVDEAAKAYGDVKVDTTTNSGKVTVNVTPRAGYKVKSITWRGLNPSDSTYTTGTFANTNSCTFEDSMKDITVFVEYEEDGTGNTEYEESDPDLFDGDTELPTVNISQMVTNVTDSTDDVSAESGAALSQATVALTLSGIGGNVLTYETDPSDPKMSLSKVAPGQELRLVVNPDEGKLLKRGGLKVTYTVTENGKPVKKTIVVNPDSSGRYFVTIPENIVASAGVAVKAEFIDSGSEDVEPGPRGTQLTGSIAVTVATNDNQALIDSTASVEAGGDTILSAVGSTDVNTVADGTAITQANASETDPFDEKAIPRNESATYTEETTAKADGTSSHDIRVRTWSVKDANGQIISGEISYDHQNAEEDAGYVFLVTPAAGFVLDGNLAATWVDEDGIQNRKVLTDIGNGYWYLNPDGIAIPDDAEITVTGGFKADMHAYSTTNDAHGRLILYDEQVRALDTPTVSVKPDDGYTVQQVVITYQTSDGTAVPILAWVPENPEEQNGSSLCYTVPENIPSGAVIHVAATYKQKTIALSTGLMPPAGSDQARMDSYQCTLSEPYGAIGDTVTVTPSEDRLKEGYKVISGKVTDANGTVTTFEGDSFSVPNAASLTIESVLGLKEIVLNKTELDHGDVIPVYARADRGEIVKVKIDPDDNYRMKQGTLKAVIRAKDGSYTEEVYMNRQSDFLYTFIMPLEISNPADVEIIFTGEFEDGQSGEGVTTSLGAGLAVTVAQSHNRADLKGTVTSKDDIRLEAFGNDSVRTESMAGYNSSGMGIGGALSLQVASIDSKARIHKGAALTLDGDLAVEAEEHAVFYVDADASGSKRQAKGTGVGAGIAVGIDGADTVAAVADQVNLRSNLFNGITIRADQTLKDTVTAAAGAASSGTSLMATGAVDIIGTSATAYMGKTQYYSNPEIELKLHDGASITASNLAYHTIGAEGAVVGKGTGLGAAVGLSIVTDVSKATLAKNLTMTENGALKIASVTESSVHNTETATAAGGRVPFRLKLTDSIVAKLLMGVADLAAMSGNYYITKEQLNTILKYRLRTVTTAGTIGVSAAAAANVQQSRSVSEIKDGVNVNATGRVSVTSENRTEAVVKANGSTVDSVTGIGVGAALNLVDIENIARIGTGTIQAGSLVVAALTREKTPEFTENSVEINNREDVENLISETMGDYVSDLVKEIGLDTMLAGEVSLKDDIVNTIVKDLTSEIMDAGELFGFVSDIDIGAAIDAVLNEEKMHTIGDKVAVPIVAVLCLYCEIPDTRLDKFRKDFVDTFEKEFVGTLDTEFRGMLGGIIQSTLTYVLNNLWSIMTGDVSKSSLENETNKLVANLKSEVKRMSSKTLKKAISKAVKASLNTLKANANDLAQDINDLTEDSFDSLLDELDQSGRLSKALDLEDVVDFFLDDEEEESDQKKDAKASGGRESQTLAELIDETADEIADSICDVIKLEETVDNLAETDVNTVITEGITSAAEEHNILLNDEQLAILVNPTDLVIESKKASYGSHLIDTQAISGAGSRGMGAAGSAAFTNLDSDTRAELSDQGGAVTVAGDMHVIADEERFLNNVASAALNAKGNANANTSAGEAANMDVGDSDDVQSVAEGKSVRLTVGLGGTAEIPSGEMTKDRPRIRITLQPGFLLEKDQNTGKSYASYSYNDETGYEVTGEKIEVKSDANGLYIDTADLAAQGVKAGTEVYLELNPVEDLRSVPTPRVKSEVSVAQDAVTVGVKNREVVGDKLKARAGDTVTVTVKKAKGRRLETISITWKDSSGKVHTADINPSLSTPGHETIFSMVTSSPDEFVYSFRMPEGDLTNIDVRFVAGDESDASQSPYSIFKLSTSGFSTNGSGRGIGAGVSFAMVTGSSAVEAIVGKRGTGNVQAGSLTVSAASEHEEMIASAAGTDPLSGSSTDDDGSYISLDASAAVNMLDNSIKAAIADQNHTTVTGYQEGNVRADGDLSVTALEESTSNVSASAFNVGLETAVGATVAVNFASSDIDAAMGSVDANGAVIIAADSHSKDYTSAVASAVGQDVVKVLRYCDVDEDGSVTPKGGTSGSNADNTTASTINERLNQNKSEDGQDADNNLPLSMNVLRSQAVEPKNDAAEQENKDAWDEINEGLGTVMKGVALGYDIYGFFASTKYQVSAAVGMTKADHNANVSVGGNVKSGNAIAITADNNGNFATLGTSAAASVLLRANSISGGAAVSQSDNKAAVHVKGDLISTNNGDITVKSTLTQNMDEDFIDKMTAQSLSGALSGPMSTMSIGGAVSLVQSKAGSTVNIDGGSYTKERTIQGGNITIEANDKSRLNGRAGGVSISLGSTIGIGASAAVIMSENTVQAKIGDYTQIEGNSLTIGAKKQAVTGDDYRNLLAMRDQKDNDDLISVTESSDKKHNSAKVNLYADKVVKTFDGVNEYAFQNNYAQALSGSVKTSWGGVSLAGAGAVILSKNKIEAGLGSNVNVSLLADSQKEKADGHMTVSALDEATTRAVGGALSASAAGGTLGVTAALVSNQDKANALIGDKLKVTEAVDVTQKAEVNGDVQVFTASAGVGALAKESSNTITATVNLIRIGSEANASLGAGARITNDGKIAVTSGTKLDLLSIGANATQSIAGLSGGGLAAGGTVSLIRDKAAAKTTIGEGSDITSHDDINIASAVSNQLIAGAASQAAALSTGAGVAAAVNVVSSGSTAKTMLGKGTDVNSWKNVDVTADSDNWVMNVTAALPLAIGSAMGGSFNINLFEREAIVEMMGGSIHAGKDARIRSNAADHSLLAGLIMSGGVTGVGISGSVILQKENNTVKTEIGKGETKTSVEGQYNTLIESNYSDDTRAVAPTVAISGMSAAVGVTDITVLKNNKIHTLLGKSDVRGLSYAGAAAAKNLIGENSKGLYIGANATEKQLLAGAGVSFSGGAAITPTSVNVKSSNQVYVDASKAALTGSDIAVKASDTVNRRLFAGGLNIGLAAGIGAAAVVLTTDNDVKALVKDAKAEGKLDIGAANQEDLLLLNVNAGGSAGAAVEIGANVTDQHSKVNAITAGDLKGSSIDLKAENTVQMTNAAVALGISGGIGAIPVFAYSSFSGETNAIMGAGTVRASDEVHVSAVSGKVIDQYTVGAAFSGMTAISGAVAVNNVKDQTNALVTKGSSVTVGTTYNSGAISILADSAYKYFGETASYGASGETTATVNGIVSLLKASTLSELEGKATTGIAGKVSVKASANRDVTNLAVNVAGSGEAAAGITVMVLEAGDFMDEDAAQQLTYGSSADGKRKAFDATDLVKHLKKEGIDTSSMEKLPEDLKGNGQKLNTNDLVAGDKAKFDASSGYNSQSDSDDDDGKTKETADLANARKFGSTTYTSDPLDSVSARIGGNAEVKAGKIEVEALQETLADLFGATVGIGGEIGGGISFAMARLRSNVLATSIGKLNAGSITVNAISRSGEVTPKAGSDEANRMKGVVSQLKSLNPKVRSIRAIGLVASGAGEGAVAASLGGVRMDNVTKATLGGEITDADSVTVNSDALYKDILAATFSVALSGIASVAASVSLAVAEGTVSSTLDTTANISGIKPQVNVTTNSNISVDSIAAAGAFGGKAGVIAGLSLANNGLQQDTVVQQGAKITSENGLGGTLNVLSESKTKADALLMGVSAGLVGVGMGLGISKVKPILNTTVGVSGAKETDGIKYVTLTDLTNVNVKNTVTSTATADILSATAGAIAAAGNVLLVYNDTEALAKAANVTGSITGDFNINGKLFATGTSQISAFDAGGISVGVTVNHVDVNAQNKAELDSSNFGLNVGGTLSVTTGEKRDQSASAAWDTAAIAKSLAVSVGAVNIGVNTAIARNRTLNDAVITGTNLNVNKVVLGSYGTGIADAYLTGVSEGAVNIATSVVHALNETTDRAYMYLKGAMNGDLTAETDVRGKTLAHMITGTGSLVGGVTTNVATARGLTVALTDVRIGAPSMAAGRSIAVSSYGRDDVISKIENLADINLILSVGTMVGRSFSKDVYDAKLELSGGTYTLDKVSVTTDYTTNTTSDVTPSTSGVKISTVSMAVNKAVAKNKAYAGASLSLKNAKLKTDNDVNVLINGNETAKAEVHPAKFTLDLQLGVGVNKANAAVEGTQAAMLLLGNGGIEKAKNVNVKSIVATADATASIGSSGKEHGSSTRIGAIAVDTNSANATESIASTAAVLGGSIKTRLVETYVDHGYYTREDVWHYDYEVLHEGYHIDRDEDGNAKTYNSDDLWFIYCRYPKEEVYGYGYVKKEDATAVMEALNKEEGYEGWERWHVRQGHPDPNYAAWSKALVDGQYYEWVYDTQFEWHPVLVKMLVPQEYVDLDGVDPADNILQAQNLNVYSGVASGKQTGATANTDAAKAYGLLTAGDLKASSSTSENYSAAFEGVTATIAGNARLEAHGNTSSTSLGYIPGGWSAVRGYGTEANAGVGSETNAQHVDVIIGENSILKAGSVDLIALNEGQARSVIDGDTGVSLLMNITKSEQPTESWYKTLVTVGKGANVEATSGDVRILSVDAPEAESKIKSSSFTIGLDYNSAMGENIVHQVNNVDFVKNSSVKASKNVVVQAYQTTRATAETKYDGTGVIIAGNTAKARNVVDRIVRINVDKNANLTATEGYLRLESFSGTVNEAKEETAGIDLSSKRDKIQTTAYVEAKGIISLGNAKAYSDVASTAEITVASGANLSSKRLLALEALSTSNSGMYTFNGTDMESEDMTNAAGIVTTANVKGSGLIPVPNAVAKSNLNFNTFVNINKGEKASKAILNSSEGVLRVRASNDRLYVQNKADALGKGAVGVSNANAWINVTLTNAVWIDAAELTGQKGIDISADTGGMKKGNKNDSHDSNWVNETSDSMIRDPYRAVFEAISTAKLKGVGGAAKAFVYISGTQINQIRTNDASNVTFISDGYVSHVAADPTTAVRLVVSANASVPKILGIKLGKTTKKKLTEWYYYDRCDFCGTGTQYDVDPTPQEDPEKRYKEADERMKQAINDVQDQVSQYTVFEYYDYDKALMPIDDIDRLDQSTDSATRARFGEEEYLAARDIFVLEIRHILKKDVRLDADRMMPYRLWTNSETFHTVYLLPNAAQLYVGAGGRPQYVADILSGNVFGDGKNRYIALYSALTDYAWANPVISIGSTGKLDFSTGTLTIPSFADFELYLHEISSAWFIEQLESGFFRTLIADQDALNGCALNGGSLPKGDIAEGLTDAGEKDGWKLYWLGETPETAADPDQTLLYLLVNDETDEVDAFRTTVNMLENEEEPVDVSLYIYRDAAADILEEEKYNVFYFDTPEGEMSLVKLVTNTMEKRLMIMPRSLQIVLRPFPVKGMDMPAFSMNDVALILTERRNNTASALDGFYKAYYDENTFDSPYTRVEGIQDGDLSVTIKKGQPIWPERTGSDSAEALDGTIYLLIDGVWYEESEAPQDAV